MFQIKIYALEAIAPKDIEMIIFETPKENCGIRGQNTGELQLNDKVKV